MRLLGRRARTEARTGRGQLTGCGQPVCCCVPVARRTRLLSSLPRFPLVLLVLFLPCVVQQKVMEMSIPTIALSC